VKFGIIVFPGSNCDHDAYHVISKQVGQPVDFIWHRDTNLSSYDAVIYSRGFFLWRLPARRRACPLLAGDGVGKEVCRVREICAGICTVFRFFAKRVFAGRFDPEPRSPFHCEHIHVRVETSDTPFTNEMQAGSVRRIPIAHAEGNYVCDDETLDQLRRDDRIVFRYCDATGDVTSAANPNGSRDNIAGICDTDATCWLDAASRARL